MVPSCRPRSVPFCCRLLSRLSQRLPALYCAGLYCCGTWWLTFKARQSHTSDRCHRLPAAPLVDCTHRCIIAHSSPNTLVHFSIHTHCTQPIHSLLYSLKYCDTSACDGLTNVRVWLSELCGSLPPAPRTQISHPTQSTLQARADVPYPSKAARAEVTCAVPVSAYMQYWRGAATSAAAFAYCVSLPMRKNKKNGARRRVAFTHPSRRTDTVN